ncbi:hypothetical protein BaRGS_00029103 [Batillaria attramentaria]|uniref:Uncharacterized protein n=1 Tax=Batillaria attramentaria TaxID=370345 RepID=A0ABD0JX98_9CAEN
MDRVLFVFALGCLASLAVGQIRNWSYKEFPDPHSYDTYSQCRRSNLSNICDPDELLSRDDADDIDSLIHSIHRETRYENNTSMDAMLRDAQMYAYLLTDRWAMKGWCNESILILYSRYDGVLYTLTLKGARQKLTDDDIQKITLAVRPYFDDSETVGDGLKEMVSRYKYVLLNEKTKGLRPGMAARQSGGVDRVFPSFFTSVVLSALLIFLAH